MSEPFKDELEKQQAKRLAEQLELPPGARSAQDDEEIKGILSLAEQLSEEWHTVKPQAGAAERVHERVTADGRPGLLSRLREVSLPRWSSFGVFGQAATVAGAFVVALVVVTMSGTFDQSAQAGIPERAAAVLSVKGRILHVVSARSASSGVGAATSHSKSDSWSYFDRTSGGLRQRSVSYTASGRLADEIESVQGKTIAIRSYRPDFNMITIRETPSLTGKAPTTATPGVLNVILKALKDKRTRVVGKTTINGKEAYELKLPPQKTGPVETERTYFVDAQTYHPLKYVEKRKIGRQVLTTTEMYLEYQLLKPTVANLHLLELAKHPGAKVVRIGGGSSTKTGDQKSKADDSLSGLTQTTGTQSESSASTGSNDSTDKSSTSGNSSSGGTNTSSGGSGGSIPTVAPTTSTSSSGSSPSDSGNNSGQQSTPNDSSNTQTGSSGPPHEVDPTR